MLHLVYNFKSPSMGYTSVNLYVRNIAQKFAIRKNNAKMRKIFRKLSQNQKFEIFRTKFRNNSQDISKTFENSKLKYRKTPDTRSGSVTFHQF